MTARYTRATALVVLSLGLMVPLRAAAQSGLPSFSELTGTVNPLGLLDIATVGGPSFVDLDGDGALDLIYDAADVEFFLARGGGNVPLLFFAGVVGSEGFADAEVNPFLDLSTGDAAERGSAPAFGDLDGDGDQDFVIGASGESSAPRYVYFENTGSATAPAFTRRDGASNPFASVTAGLLSLADLDGDNDLDVTVALPGEDGASVLYFQNTGTPQAATFASAPSPFVDITFDGVIFPLAFGDLDGDSDLDAVVGGIDAFGSGQGSLRLLRNTGTPEAPVFALVSPNPLASVVFGAFGDDTVYPTVADLDSDGDADVVVIRGVGPFPESLLLENESTGSTLSFTLRAGFENPVRVRTPIDEVIVPTAAGDLDGDGDQDLVIGLTTEGPLYYAENVGTAEQAAFRLRTGTANPFRVYTNPTDAFAAPLLVDLDGDGDLDVAITSADLDNGTGQIVYLENTGTPTAPAYVRRTGAANPFGALDIDLPTSGAFADLDGDGDLDFAVVNADAVLAGTLRYFENTGTSSAAVFTRRTGDASPLPTVAAGTFFRGVAFGDLDGDADADLLLTEADIDSETGMGRVRTFENVASQGAASFSERTGDDNPIAGTFEVPMQPSIADFDGDGNADVVLGTGLVVDFGDGEFGLVGNRFRFFINEGIAPVSVDAGVPTIDGFALSAAYPNPFAGETHIGLTLDREQAVTVAVYDALGRCVAVLHDGPLAAGEHTLRVDGSALAAGVYVIHARSVGGTASQRITNVR